MQSFIDCSAETLAHKTKRTCVLCEKGFKNGEAMVEIIAHQRSDITWITKGAAHPKCVEKARSRCAACGDDCLMKHNLCPLP